MKISGNKVAKWDPLGGSPEASHKRQLPAECANIEQAEADIAMLQGEAIKRRAYYNRTHVFVTITFLPTQPAFRIGGQGVSALGNLLPSRER